MPPASEKPRPLDTVEEASERGGEHKSLSIEGEEDEEEDAEAREVFKIDGAVDFRTVGWKRCAVIFLKIIFATGVLSIPVAMASLGAVGGSLSVVGWGALNTYTAVIQGDFRNRHRGCHSIADMAHEVGGWALRELVGLIFIVAYVLCTGAGILGVSIALNVFSGHGACTVWWTLVASVLVALAASVRKFHELGWLTWAGFVSIFTAVLVVVVAVTLRDRPAAAPRTGDFELGYFAVASPGFAAGMVATSTIFVSSAGTSAFLPVISEMRRPRDYRKALFASMAFVTASYLAFSLVVYRWCGQWVASPSLGSAGDTVKVAAYAVGFLGLIVSACLYLHVAAKYCFVRVLRGSRHLQANTAVHWGTWLACTFGLCAVSFLLAEAVPIFNFLVALTGSTCFAPLALMLPGWLWIHDHRDWIRGGLWQRTVYCLHLLLILLGVFVLAGGTYGVVKQIIAAYASGSVGGAFSCADNSGSVH